MADPASAGARGEVRRCLIRPRVPTRCAVLRSGAERCTNPRRSFTRRLGATAAAARQVAIKASSSAKVGEARRGVAAAPASPADADPGARGAGGRHLGLIDGVLGSTAARVALALLFASGLCSGYQVTAGATFLQLTPASVRGRAPGVRAYRDDRRAGDRSRARRPQSSGHSALTSALTG